MNGGLSIDYDDGGSLTQIGGFGFAYDAEGRLKSSTVNSVTTTYDYDGEGRRVKKTKDGATTVYVYDAMGKLAAEYGGTADGAGTQYLTTDHLGSTRLVTDAAGSPVKRYDFLPFGEEIPSGIGFRTSGLGYGSDSFPLKFTGKERDTESNLDYFGARYLSGAQGRFTSPDPLLASGRAEDLRVGTDTPMLATIPSDMLIHRGLGPANGSAGARLHLRRRESRGSGHRHHGHERGVRLRRRRAAGEEDGERGGDEVCL